MSEQGQRGYVAVEGGQLYYDVVGEGQPLVLLHASVADHTLWDAQVAAFAPYYRVIRYDLRGCGKTISYNATFSNRQDLLDLLNHLGVEKAIVLGLSAGGSIATDFTVEHPERVSALIVAAGGLGGAQAAVTATEAAACMEMDAAERAKDYDRLTALETEYWVEGPGQEPGRAPESVRAYVRDRIAANHRIHGEEALQPQPLVPPSAGRLESVKVPTLVMVGDLDESAIIMMMRQLAADVAGAQLVVFPQVAHMINLEEPNRFNEVVLSFLHQVGL